MRHIGSSIPGYSKATTVKVTKNGYRTYGTAFAVQNDYYMRCEVRGATSNGAYLTCR